MGGRDRGYRCAVLKRVDSCERIARIHISDSCLINGYVSESFSVNCFFVVSHGRRIVTVATSSLLDEIWHVICKLGHPRQGPLDFQEGLSHKEVLLQIEQFPHPCRSSMEYSHSNAMGPDLHGIQEVYLILEDSWVRF